MDGCQGGNVTSEDGLLIERLAYITENTDEWTKFSADFEYFSEETPEYINVITSAGDNFAVQMLQVKEQPRLMMFALFMTMRR